MGREERRDAERMKKSGVGERREGVCVEKKKKVVMMEEEMEEEECGDQLGRRVSTHDRGEREAERRRDGAEGVWRRKEMKKNEEERRGREGVSVDEVEVCDADERERERMVG